PLYTGEGGWQINLNQTSQSTVEGCTTFSNLGPGSYTVSEANQDGWTQTYPVEPNNYVVNASSGQNQNLEFANFHNGRITGYKYDWNTENTLDGWTICLVKQQIVLDRVIQELTIQPQENCVVTGAGEWPDGYYEFTGLLPGTYKVYENLMYGWTQMQPVDPNYHTVVVTSGTGYGEAPSYDFWNRKNEFNVDIEKTADKEIVEAGDNLTYTLNWSVTGNTPVEVNLFDEIPVNTTFVSASDGGFLDGNTVRWNLGSFNPNANGSVTLTVKVNSPLPNQTVISNTGNICGLGEIPDGEPFFSNGEDLRRQKCDKDDITTTVHAAPTLGIEKTANPATVGGLEDVTYTITWSVAGNSQATNVLVTDPIPANTTYVSMSCGTTAGTCNMSQTGTPVSSVAWDLGNRNPGENGTLTLVVKTDISVPNGTVIPNVAKIQSAEVDPLFAQADVKAATAPQLQITKTVSANIVNPGDPVTYAVKVKNIGTDTAINVTLTDTLPAGFAFVDGGVSTKTFSLGNLAVGEEKTVSYAVNVSPSATAGDYDNMAKAKADNAAEVSTKVTVEVKVPKVLGEQTQPILQLKKSVNKTTAAPNDVLTYTVEIKNTGTGAALNVKLEDIMPLGFTFFNTEETTKSWQIGDINPGETKTVNYQVKVGASVPAGDYENVAIVTADNHGRLVASAPVEVKRGRVLAETVDTGAGLTDAGIAALGLSLIVLGYVLIRRRNQADNLA
ncbi:DUF11 domain-containing protein, partial [Candidatus Parcubacteria bacterium]